MEGLEDTYKIYRWMHSGVGGDGRKEGWKVDFRGGVTLRGGHQRETSEESKSTPGDVRSIGFG